MGASMRVTSSSFAVGSAIPARFTCRGADVSPALRWDPAPDGTQSIALSAIDPDAPGRPFVHWLVFNMPSATMDLAEGAAPPEGSVLGRNDFGSSGYRGPCPPPGSPHHYHFKVYALDMKLGLRPGASESAFQDAIKDHVLATGEIVGTFKR